MLVVRQPNRLGNQLFSIANAMAKAKEQIVAIHENYPINSCLETPFPVYKGSAFSLPVYKNEGLGYFEYELPKTPDDSLFIEGYYQSEKFFQSQDIRQRFKCKYEKEIKNVFRNVFAHETIALHVRRTDYLTDPRYTVLPISYYTKAIETMLANFDTETNYLILIFSDDIKWCEKQFGDSPRFKFINSNPTEMPNDVFELYLMSYCKHHIIANSSFSWWGAWLGDGGIVICPNHTQIFNHYDVVKHEYNDYYNEKWIEIPLSLVDSKRPILSTVPLTGFQSLKVYELAKYLDVYSVLDKIGVLKDCPNIISYNEKRLSYDLVCETELSTTPKSKYTILCSPTILQGVRFLQFHDPFVKEICHLYLIDNYPEQPKELFTGVINLDTRSDRWNSVKPRLRGLVGLPTDFNPQQLNKGKLGCLKSHEYLMLTAWRHNYAHSLNLEDDVVLCKEFEKRLNETMHELREFKYDVCQLSAIIWADSSVQTESVKYNHLKGITTGIVQTVGSGTHAMLINSSSFEKLLNLYSYRLAAADDSLNCCTVVLKIPFLATTIVDPKSDVSPMSLQDITRRKKNIDNFCRQEEFSVKLMK